MKLLKTLRKCIVNYIADVFVNNIACEGNLQFPNVKVLCNCHSMYNVPMVFLVPGMVEALKAICWFLPITPEIPLPLQSGEFSPIKNVLHTFMPQQGSEDCSQALCLCWAECVFLRRRGCGRSAGRQRRRRRRDRTLVRTGATRKPLASHRLRT